MDEYIKREDLINGLMDYYFYDEDGSMIEDEGDDAKRKWIDQWLPDCPAADVVEVVRCKDCKHRILNKRYGERGYMNIKAACDLDTGDPYQLGRFADVDDWFCADGERKGKTDDFE